MLNPILKGNVRGGNIQGGAHLQNQNNLITESYGKPKRVVQNKKNEHENPMKYYRAKVYTG